MKVPPLDLPRQHEPLMDELQARILSVLRSGQYVLGPEVAGFEQEVATYLRVRRAVAVSNGTDALVVALKACGVGIGDRVLTSPFTFFATVSAIVGVGAEPVFADIREDTFNLCPVAVRDRLEQDSERRIRAVIPVHLFGQASDLFEIRRLSQAHGAYLVEDAAQAIGTPVWADAQTAECAFAGGVGDFGCFSLFPTKNLGSIGEGGLVTTQNEELAQAATKIRVHGSAVRYVHEQLGGNFRMHALQAAALRVFLPHLDSWIEQRRALAKVYDEALGPLHGLQTPARSADSQHTFHQYTLRIAGGRDRRDNLFQFLQENGIGCAIYYPIPCHLQQALQPWGFKKGEFPKAEAASEQVLSLPIFPGMTEQEQQLVIDAVRQWAKVG